MTDLEKYFKKFRENIIGINATYDTLYGKKKILYADWIGSGRLYGPIEKVLYNRFGPFVANTHTETSETGTRMTLSYQLAHELIKKHVNAGPNDVIITAGSGMTTVVNKLQRILGLKGCGKLRNNDCIQLAEKPVVFITHMEHHSNHTSWYETNSDVVLLQPDDNLLVNIDELRRQLEKYKDRNYKVGAFTACSNVTGILTPYYQMAKVMHEHGGLCFIDFAASAPFNLIVKLLSDRFGIQVRGGCACAGTYGHFLLEVSYDRSKEITEKVNHGDLSEKPGWVRWSIHPTMTDDEVHHFIRALKSILENINEWKKDYVYLKNKNEFVHKDFVHKPAFDVKDWFNF